jgi:hypothetical protein
VEAPLRSCALARSASFSRARFGGKADSVNHGLQGAQALRQGTELELGGAHVVEVDGLTEATFDERALDLAALDEVGSVHDGYL